MKGFIKFIREQGVVGLATGFILGGAISKLVAALVEDIINPLIGIILGKAGDLSTASFQLAGAQIMWGNFVATLINFFIVALVVYIGVKILGIDKLDTKKSTAKR